MTYNSAFTVLRKLEESSEDGRWPVIASDLGNRPVHDFNAEAPAELAMNTGSYITKSSLRRTEMSDTRGSVKEEGMADFFELNHGNIIPEAKLVTLVGEGKGPGCGFKFAGSRSGVPYEYAFGAQNHTVIRAPNCTTTMLLVVLQNMVICVSPER